MEVSLILDQELIHHATGNKMVFQVVVYDEDTVPASMAMKVHVIRHSTGPIPTTNSLVVGRIQSKVKKLVWLASFWEYSPCGDTISFIGLIFGK